MATAEIRIGTTMGAGAPVYGPAAQSQTLTTTTSNATSTVAPGDGDYVRVVARGGDVYVEISKTAATAPRDCVPAGTSIDIGPLKYGDIINAIDA
jgi:hypothetical protein